MKSINLLAVIFSLLITGFSAKAQSDNLDSLSATGLYQGQNLELSLQNSSATDLCVTYIFVPGSTASQGNIIIQDDVMFLRSGQLVLMPNESRTVYLPLDPTAPTPTSSTVSFQENCAVGNPKRIFQF